MSLDAAQLFALLPAVYRNRDAANGGPLQALFAVMAAQSAIVEDNIKQLYDDQFIETCAPWVIPYIGDLIGYNSIYQVAAASDSRAEVANTIGYRRRKGTLIALEQLATDVSGRACVVVEAFKRLIVTESMRDVRPRHAATADLRRVIALDRLGTAFDTTNRTIDVRRIAPRLRPAADPDPTPLDIALHGPGRFNIPDVAIWLWRWKSARVVGAPAYPVGGGRFKFSPLGQDIPLFNNPPQRASFDRLTASTDLPQPIRRDEFARNIAAYYGPSLLLVADGAPVDARQICCANLADRAGGAWCRVPSGCIAVDPELGRIQYAADIAVPQTLLVTYCFGFPAEIGGGPYDRTPSLLQLDPAQGHVFAVGSSHFRTVESAVAAWNALPAGSVGIITLSGYQSYHVDLTGAHAVRIPPESKLAIVAVESNAGDPGQLVFNNACVTLMGNVEVQGTAGERTSGGEPLPAGQLLISGLWIAGQMAVSGGSVTVQIFDSTLVPGAGLSGDGDPVHPGEPSIVVTAAEADLTLNRAITGPIAADAGGTTRVCASIVDATSPYHVAYAGSDLASAGADLHVEDSTIVGKVRTRTIPLASNTIFHARLGCRDPWAAAVWASRRQTGCVRFCSLPFASITPRRYRCLPTDAASEAQLEPTFITLRYGQPSYALLSGDVPMAVWRGADNGTQIGVYGQIQETEAVRNVQLRAPEYLPAALECGVFLTPSRAVHQIAAEQPYYYRRRAADGEEHFGIGIGLI
jgi:uncharacterized Zn-binding protein involved in type VI secretion